MDEPAIYETGYVREGGQAYNPTAVRWWLLCRDPDGFTFGRGGRCHSARRARALLALARIERAEERTAWINRRTHELVGHQLKRRFTHELQPDGSLRPLIPNDFEV